MDIVDRPRKPHLLNVQRAKAYTVIDRLSIIWRENISDKIKCKFVQAVVDSTLWMHHVEADLAYREKAKPEIAQESYHSN